MFTKANITFHGLETHKTDQMGTVVKYNKFSLNMHKNAAVVVVTAQYCTMPSCTVTKLKVASL